VRLPGGNDLNDVRSRMAPPPADFLAATPLRDLIGAIRAAKIGVAGMYVALADGMPGVEAGLSVRRLADEEIDHARRLSLLLGDQHGTTRLPAAPPAPGCGLNDESWPSALMAAFALDQAGTAALLGIARLGEGSLAETAASIVEEERAHQSFAVAAFRSVADRDPDAGRRLAREMIAARDWVKSIFPRHKPLVELANDGLLPTDAATAHDSFLASLGDRLQEALGVLGD